MTTKEIREQTAIWTGTALFFILSLATLLGVMLILPVKYEWAVPLILLLQAFAVISAAISGREATVRYLLYIERIRRPGDEV